MGEVIVSSTTDSQAAVDAAAKAFGEQPEEEKVEPSESPEKDKPEDESEAESEPAEKPESEEPEEEELQTAGKSRKRLLRQVSRLTGRNYKLQEQLEELQTRLEQIQTGTAKPVEAAPAGRPRPTQDNYKSYEDFVEALADWRMEERDREKALAAQNAYVQQVYTEYNQQVDAARDTHDDWDEVVGQSVSVPQIAINMMYELDNGAEVAYHLGKHPEIREQLLEWNEPGTKGGLRKIVVELDRISDKLSGKSSSQDESSPRPRSAPPPPAPIRPVGATARSTVDPGQMSMRDYKKWIAHNYPHMR